MHDKLYGISFVSAATFILLAIYFSSCVSSEKLLKQKEAVIEQYQKDTSGISRWVPNIRLVAGDTVCDIGGGWGYSSSFVGNYFPGVIFYEEDIVRKCNKKTFERTFKLFNSRANLQNYRFFTGTETRIPFPDNYFKAATIFISIHEFTDKYEMLGEAARIIRDNGKLYIYETVYSTTPEADPNCKLPYLSEKELTDLVTSNRFEISNVIYGSSKDTSENKFGLFLECTKLQGAMKY